MDHNLYDAAEHDILFVNAGEECSFLTEVSMLEMLSMMMMIKDL